jgi:spore coat polysaccharide biosynthesis protein SpsF
MKKLIVIQARLGSTRFPNKVMMPLKGRPLLLRMIQRVAAVKVDCDLIVATTTNPEDDTLRDLCKKFSIPCYSGHLTDLLDRHYQAAKQNYADVVIKIPSDCPLIDPRIIDKVVRFYDEHSQEYDYVSNLHPATYPDGNDVEIMPFQVLEYAWKEAQLPMEREHTTPFIWERPERFRIGNVTWGTGKDYSMTHRWTIDYPEDFIFIKNVYDHLWTADNPIFSLYEILALLREEPILPLLNAKYAGVNWYGLHLHELKTITQKETKILAEAVEQ